MPPTQQLPTEQTPQQRGPGAQPGDRRAFRHGLRSPGYTAKCRKEEQNVNSFRRTVEDTTFAAKGEVTLSDALAINTATRWERHALLAARWLRLHGDAMDHTERLSFSREVARASTERDKALATLQLNARPRAFNGTIPKLPKLIEAAQ